MTKTALFAALLTVCLVREARADDPSLRTGMFVLAETSLAVDMLQTASAIHAGFRENNVLLGSHPSNATMLAYFGSCMLATAAGTYLLPDGLRVFVPALVLMLEVPQIAQNASVRVGFSMPF